ncbi:LuxR family transcriptional activator of conjugal transfer of Ti plasmids [Rhizobium sp. BK313]|uniref:autoinducer binding domain-containing protein n=1 Tax=Rhizobium sp. BK313 TaxID=2587081 RepID=UPI0010DF4E5A|nr:autoinducer binding domain-containing protein [Rhizobium sp. BK313]MBB3458829.1 LuxR family transcriptional activator of conjugal transfer of Ti plasmids [Rhizobium sp. BK313]
MNQWFEHLTEQVSLASDEVAIKSTLQRLALEKGFTAFAYLSLQAETQTAISSYPPEWQERYFLKSYATIDPVISSARSQMEAFAWSHAYSNRTNKERRAFCDEAAEFGIRCGITVPIKTGFGRIAMLTFASNELDVPRARALNPVLAASAVGQVHSRLELIGVHPTRQSPIRLKADELTCLRWSAEGKSMRAIAIIENTSYANVAFFLRNAKAALGATTLPQATAMATKLGLI